ncbi:CDP-alcohol phosphatidyltransferase domain-containing protein [Cryptosporidium muris RN66]|uniref:CDP-alcohol phosphatidyltransferase domain-containing protein n=1 Tax=Cryptosporidium muris (strain RN66) TaxID=441375 RepID=B6AD28_CRYMR|nr:CDP-alcohol phosphatidyltransferase domain-containing protein [Cryptosporidium muris RN66]EEA06032.1 CDP-alcohol phosphatidyltransferase domain-containing protein [Cryptosporidium muris RN66]|eukprot:XP_002140381.1 CDP-alcohol phosphatidyltransferase domain-containing protein [Cryptosporidium muris RN66]
MNEDRTDLPKIGLFGRYVTTDGLRRIESYNYNGGGATYCDEFMNIFWDYFVKSLPETLPPNGLTILGFICSFLSILILLVYSPSLDQRLLLPSTLAIVLLLFLYQTLDAADGKQARRLKLSSPLGQLLDHGLDSYSTIFLTTIVCGTCCCGWNFATFALISIAQLKMMIYMWLEYHCHVYRCSASKFLGVTESQFFVMLLLLFTVFDNYNTLHMIILYKVTISDIMLFSIGIFGIFTIAYDILLGIRVCQDQQSKKAASLEVCGALSHIAFQILFFASGVFNILPISSFYVFVTSSSIIALRMNVSAFSKDQLPYLHWPVLPFYIGSILLFFGPVIFDMTASSPKSVLCLIAIWNSLYTIDFSVTTISDICTHLGISMFQTSNVNSVNKRKNDFVQSKDITISNIYSQSSNEDSEFDISKLKLMTKKGYIQDEIPSRAYSISRSARPKLHNRK